MRTLEKRSIVMTIALLAALALSSAASAISIDVEWRGSGTTLTGTDFVGSELVTLELYASVTVPPGLDSVGVTISWDPGALSLVQCTPANTTKAQYVAGGSFQPFNKGDGATCDTPGTSWQPALVQLANYQPYLAGPGVLHIADLQFHVLGVAGNTIVQSLFNPVADGWGDNNFVFALNATFSDATVHVIPEPTTALLVGIGFIGLLAAGRRRR
jgi:hypothetical protein